MAKLKQANSTPEEGLEQAFFQLAYERLQEKLKNLLDKLIGFQVINKSDDGTRAVGVFGFQADNGHTLFVPCFFKDGDIKGVEMIYSKNNEQFYPLNEDFAEMFLKDEPTGIGQASEDSASDINQFIPPTDLRDMVRPPRTAKISYASVIDFVENGDDNIKTAFYKLLEDSPEYTESILTFYDLDKVAKALQKKVLPNAHIESPKVKVYTRKDSLVELPDEVKQRVYSQGYVIIDSRKADQKSKFGLKATEEKFTNPSKEGFYPYITASGDLQYGVVITHPIALDAHFPTGESLLINLANGFLYSVKPNKIFVKDQIVVDDLSGIFEELDNPADVKPSNDDIYVMINDKLQCSEPFRVRVNFKDAQGLRRLEVEKVKVHDCECDDWRNPVRKDKPNNSYFSDRTVPIDAKTYTFVMTKKEGSCFAHSDGVVYVPKGFKMLKVFNRPGYGTPAVCNTSAEGKEEEKEYRDKTEDYTKGKPGSVASLQASLNRQGIYPMTVAANGSEYFINWKDARKSYPDPVHAKIALVTEFGLDEKVASELVDDLGQHSLRTGYLKLAQSSFAPWDPTPYANELGQPTYDGVGYSAVAPVENSYTGDPTRQGLGSMPEISGKDVQIQRANQLAQAGQKEIFDTQSIATLSKYTSPASKVNDYMPDYLSCLDKLGRMLFLLHWDTDKFEELYGRSDLPELTELLSSVFKNLGELVIFLRRKSPELSINLSNNHAEI